MRSPFKMAVIDDSPDTHEMVELLLAGGPAGAPSILHAENGKAGLALIESNPDLDVIVLDLMMPVMDGFEVLERLRADRRWRQIPVLVFSANRNDATRALNLGARDFVNKPGDFQEIRLRIANLVDSKRRSEASDRTKLDFLSVVSHELRTPMNGIFGMVDALRDTGLAAEQSEFLGALDLSARRMMGLVENLLRFLETDQPLSVLGRETFDPGLLVQGVLADAAETASLGQTSLGLSLAAEVPAEVFGWPDLLRTVLGHLVGNAVKFAAGGRVEVALEVLPPSQGKTVLAFSVSDTGPGLPARSQENLMEPFLQADGTSTRRFGGLGLGLSIAARLVQQMGGVLEVESQPGQGTRFRFALEF